MINDKQNSDILQEFLNNSPYSESDKQELTLYIDGILINEPNEHTDDFSNCESINNLVFKQQKELNEVVL